MVDEPNAPDSEKRRSDRLNLSERSGARARPPRVARNRPVIVETKRKRVITAKTSLKKLTAKKTTPPKTPAGAEKTAPAAAAAAPAKENESKEIKSASSPPPPPPPPPAKKKNLRKETPSGGVILRPLTEREKQQRANVLSKVKQREKEERERAETEAQIAQSKEEKRLSEEEETRARAETLRQQRQNEEEAHQRAEVETALHSDESEAKVKKRPSSQRRPAERKRRQNKLTIANALDDSERRQSLSALRRRRQRQRPNLERGEKKHVVRDVIIPETISINELAARMARRVQEVIKFLMSQDVSVKSGDILDADTAQLVAEEFGHRIKRVMEADVEDAIDATKDEDKDLQPRPPVVTVMGHVDHGKTSLLDALRKSSIAGGEAGGITQHIGAYQVAAPSGRKITFIDTPGHAAFTAMRARGAKTTDIIVLIIAADDGIMPQTIEAINHAKAAQTPIIVGINKIDLPGADPNKIMQQLLQYDVQCEEQGGDVLCVPMSVKTGQGVGEILEAVLLQADILELKANPSRAAQGTVLEAHLDKGEGHVAMVLVQRGALRRGDVFVAGFHTGRVRRMKSDDGSDLEQAGPSHPVWVTGLTKAVAAGDRFDCVENDARAREIAEYRQRKAAESQASSNMSLSLEEQFAAKDEKPELSFIIKADVQGSADAVIHAAAGIGGENVSVKIAHAGVGEVSESDIALAEAMGASILMFNVKASAAARKAARAAKIDLRAFDIIYNLIDEIKLQLAQHLGPQRRETILGQGKILQLFGVGKNNIAAGCRVEEGQIKKDASLRIYREDVIIYDGAIQSLRRFKDNVAAVEAGQECGVTLDNPKELKPDDRIECFSVEYIERHID